MKAFASCVQNLRTLKSVAMSLYDIALTYVRTSRLICESIALELASDCARNSSRALSACSTLAFWLLCTSSSCKRHSLAKEKGGGEGRDMHTNTQCLKHLILPASHLRTYTVTHVSLNKKRKPYYVHTYSTCVRTLLPTYSFMQ